MNERFVPLFEYVEEKAPEIIRLARLRGVAEGDVFDDSDIKYVIGQEERGIWDNVLEHSFAALLVTDILGSKLLLDTDRIATNKAASAHDLSKKTERMWQISLSPSVGEFTQDEPDMEIELFNDDRRKLIALENVAVMEEWENADAGLDPRVCKLMKANIPESREGHVTLPEKIMWFADACLTGTAIVPIAERFDNLENDSRNGALNLEFSRSFIPQYGISLYDVQRELGQRYVTEFSAQIGIEESHFYGWLREKFDERLDRGIMPVLA